MLRTGLSVIADDWHAELADAPAALKGRRLGVVRHMRGKDLWRAADAETRKLYEQAIARIEAQGATIIDVDLDKFDAQLGPEFIKGFGPRADAMFARYPGPRRNWREVCSSGRVRPEWSENECLTLGASAPRQERQAADRIAGNGRYLSGLLDLFQLDALVYPVDGRGGARADTSDALSCMLAGSSGLPAVAFPVGVDSRGLPLGLELLGRSRADEWLVAAMAHFEALRGPLPAPPPPAARPDLAALSIPEQNNLRLTLGWRAFQSRRGKDLGDLAADKFRALTDDVIRSWQR
jgi:aspartyl-tRNA(Asn)/glutamyl-tRNA(Gln) amidotransferase subunit A